MKWPSQSPNLNLSENLLTMLKSQGCGQISSHNYARRLLMATKNTTKYELRCMYIFEPESNNNIRRVQRNP